MVDSEAFVPARDLVTISNLHGPEDGEENPPQSPFSKGGGSGLERS